MNNIWRIVNNLRRQNLEKSNSNSNVNAFVPNYPELVFAPNIKQNEPYYRPVVHEEDQKVSQFVKFLWQEFNPTEINVYPSTWITLVLGKYRAIRKIRSKMFKDNKKHHFKNAFKGLSSHTIIAVLMYFSFLELKPKFPIPSVILLKYVNKVIKRHYKNDRLVTLKQFELYKTDPKKGLRGYLEKNGYIDIERNVSASDFTRVVSRRYFGFSKDHSLEAQKRATRLYNSQKNELNELKQLSPQLVAIASILVTAKLHKYKISLSDFEGMTKVQLQKLYDLAKHSDKLNIAKLVF